MFAILLACCAVNAGAAVKCAYSTGQTATLTTVAPREDRLTLKSREGTRDVSLIRYDRRLNIEVIDTNGGAAKQAEVARLWRLLRRRLRMSGSDGKCGTPWRFSPD
jgi:hypothetical protein